MQHLADQFASFLEEEVAEVHGLVEHLSDSYPVILLTLSELRGDVREDGVELAVSHCQGDFGPHLFLHEVASHKLVVRPGH